MLTTERVLKAGPALNQLAAFLDAGGVAATALAVYTAEQRTDPQAVDALHDAQWGLLSRLDAAVRALGGRCVWDEEG